MSEIITKKYVDYLKEFFIYFLCSMFIHAQIFIHDILECDEFGIYYRDNYLWDISLGRFGAGFYDIISSYLGFTVQSTYYLIVIFSIIISIGLIIIFNIFNIKNLIIKTILAFTCISFQSFMTINIFRCTIIRWAMSFTLPCVVSLLIIKQMQNNNMNLKKILITFLYCILLVISIGFTQAALSIFSVILLLDLINDSIDGKKTIVIFKKAIFYLIFIMVSSIIYLFTMSILQKLFHLSFARPYPDINTIVMGFIKSYGRFFWLIVKSGNLQKLFYILLYIIIIYEFIIIFLNKKTNKLTLILFSILLPLAIGLVGFMQKGGAPIRAWFSLIFIFIIPVYFFEKINNLNIKIKNINKYMVIILLVHCICNFYNTQSYYQSYFTSNEASKAFAIELASSIKNIKGYSTDKKFCIIGSPALLSKDGFTSFPGKTNLLAISWSFVDGLKKYGAIDFEMVDGNKNKELSENEEVKNMPIYPNEGSIKVINDVVVIKLVK